jgi:hypothetical protein
LHREANISDPFVEILGKVQDDLTVKVFSSMNMGNDLGSFQPSACHNWIGIGMLISLLRTDLSVVEKVVQLSHTDKASGVLND